MRLKGTWRVTTWWLCAALALPCALPAAQAPQAVDSTVPVGARLRNATLQGLNGPARSLTQFLGKPLIINVWASWCEPCRAEMASLERLAWSDQNRRFNIIGISTDDYAEQALGWLAHSNATISQFIDTRLQMEHMLGATHLPLTVLVDSSGRVLERIYGSRQWDEPQSQALIARVFQFPQP